MAGRGISIDILANVRDALKGTGDVSKALGDIESTLDDMARSGDDSTDKLSRGFRDLSRKADDSADSIERSFKQSYRDVAKYADDAADDAVRSQRRMGERSQEVGQEIRQNLGEGIANAARGDFESLADTIGDTLGGAVAGIGGIGFAAAGAAGALGLGAIVAVFQSIMAESEATEERVQAMYDRLSEAGAAYLSRANIAKALGELSQEDVLKGIERARDLQIDQSIILNAMVGDTEAIASVYATLAERKAEEVDLIRQSGVGLEEQATKIEAANTKYAEQTDWLRQIQNDTTSAAARWDAVSNAIKLANGDVSVLSQSLSSLPNPNVMVRIGADDSGFRSTFAALQRRAEQGITVTVRPGSGRFWE